MANMPERGKKKCGKLEGLSKKKSGKVGPKSPGRLTQTKTRVPKDGARGKWDENLRKQMPWAGGHVVSTQGKRVVQPQDEKNKQHNKKKKRELLTE